MQGDQLSKDIISSVGNNVGRILAIMVNLFNPRKNSDWLTAQSSQRGSLSLYQCGHSATVLTLLCTGTER
ncbi:Making large colonies protein [Hafnia alvei]|uniref:Making large colonies protein n=1 Tax=Hafnia alvei TaxID=569 RepID=A0A377PKC9_HAFAL|nr:Making large colonies protein [Hafnia alvei]